MIEIALYDGSDRFSDRKHPQIDIKEFKTSTLTEYQTEARKLVAQYSEEPVISISHYPENFQIYLFAVFLFIESLRVENKINCVAIKVKDVSAATEKFKPYIALAFGLKYVHTLQDMDEKLLFNDISALGYLGLKIQMKYEEHKLKLFLPGSRKLPPLKGESFLNTMVSIGFLKTLALMKQDYSAEAELSVFQKDDVFDEDVAFAQIIENFLSLS